MTNYNENNTVNNSDYERDTTNIDNNLVTPNFSKNENSKLKIWKEKESYKRNKKD